MRYGAFVQLWAARAGRGRVVAFTDSTIFSNFCVFEPGKSELWLGMLEWLNRTGGGDPRAWLWALAAALAVGGLLAARQWSGAWLALAAAAALGYAAGEGGAGALNSRAVPPPAQLGALVRVVVDRTVSDALLSKGGFIGGSREGFGIFEQWILRLGYFTARRAGDGAFGGDLLVVLHPSREPPAGWRDALVRYVEKGGRVLVVDSAENKASTANRLLEPFGLAVDAASNESGLLAASGESGLLVASGESGLLAASGESGQLAVPEGWPSVPVEAAREVSGGAVLARLNGKPVAAAVRRGKGTVTVLGFGSRFTDAVMGVTADTLPDAAMLKVYQLEYAILRAIVEDRLPGAMPAAP